MRKWLGVLLASMALAAGCGESSADSADGFDPESLLIQSSDLSDVSGFGLTPPEQCGPLAVLKAAGGRAAISKTFIVPEAQIVEAAAIFRTPERAMVAYEELNELERLECIGNAIAGFSPGTRVDLGDPKAIDTAGEGTVNRYHMTRPDTTAEGYADVIAIRLGRCSAALLVGTKSRKPPDAISGSAGATAADQLSDACE